jgi:hypothetical protein
MSKKRATAFQIGERVRWESQSQSSTTWKEGVIVAVVPAGTTPHTFLDYLAARYRTYLFKSFGLPRSEESYLVAVPNKNPKLRGLIYWPRAMYLERVLAEENNGSAEQKSPSG